MITFRSKVGLDKQAAIFLLSEEQIKHKRLGIFHKSVQEKVYAAISAHQFSGKEGQIFPLLSDKKLILLVGIGAEKTLSLTALRITVRKALLSSFLKEVSSLEIAPHDQKEEVVAAIIESILIGTYVWNKYITIKSLRPSFSEKQVFIAASSRPAYHKAMEVCSGMNLTRDLINDNADKVTSVYLESVIRGLIKGKKQISIEVLNKKEMQKQGLGLHLAVNQGSRNEPKLIIVSYHGGGKNEGATALVGKGITFDTGGLNIKPTGSMETMRTDMSGAAAVIGTLKNTISLNLKKNVVFVVGLAENVTGPGSYKPGDVIKGYAGKTVEIANTDAEGRLVLADAISYVVKNYKPKRLIDIATLTGACVIALGHDYSGLMTTDDELSRQIVRSSNTTDDRVWRLPIYPELKEAVKSKIADIRNLGFPKGAAGTITAAEFLHQFAQGVSWAHLDIAGTAFVEGNERFYFGHGATGVGVRLLTHFVQHHS